VAVHRRARVTSREVTTAVTTVTRRFPRELEGIAEDRVRRVRCQPERRAERQTLAHGGSGQSRRYAAGEPVPSGC